jgi:hypothetical protein
MKRGPVDRFLRPPAPQSKTASWLAVREHPTAQRLWPRERSPAPDQRKDELSALGSARLPPMSVGRFEVRAVSARSSSGVSRRGAFL